MTFKTVSTSENFQHHTVTNIQSRWTIVDGAFKSLYDPQTVVQTNDILYLLMDVWSQSFIDFQLRQKNFFVHRNRTSECDVITYDSSLMTRHCLAEKARV